MKLFFKIWLFFQAPFFSYTIFLHPEEKDGGNTRSQYPRKIKLASSLPFLCLMLTPRSKGIWSSFLSATIHANARKTQWIPNIFCALGSKLKFFADIEVLLGSEKMAQLLYGKTRDLEHNKYCKECNLLHMIILD